MLQVKSFLISDDNGINALLKKYRLASGAHILVSEGNVCVPYEDGLPANNDQKIVAVLEQKNNMLVELGILNHSQKVVETQIGGMAARITELDKSRTVTPKNKTEVQRNSEIKKEIDRLTSIKGQSENLFLQNKAEVARMETNLKVFDETVASLK